MYRGEIEEASKKTSRRSEEEVARDIKVDRNRQSLIAEEVHDERVDGVAFGERYERSVDIRVVEAKDLKRKDFVVGRGCGWESKVGKIVEGNGRAAGRDSRHVWSSVTGVVWLGSNEYVDGE